MLGNPNDPENKEFVLKALDLGNTVDAILQKNSKHVANANKEFNIADQLVQQMPPITQETSPLEIQQNLLQFVFMPPPRSWEDHSVHIQEHTNYLMDKFYKYRQQGAQGQVQYDLLLQSMDDHLNIHRSIIQQGATNAATLQTQADAFVKGNTIPQLLIKKSKPAGSDAGSNKSKKK